MKYPPEAFVFDVDNGEVIEAVSWNRHSVEARGLHYEVLDTNYGAPFFVKAAKPLTPAAEELLPILCDLVADIYKPIDISLWDYKIQRGGAILFPHHKSEGYSRFNPRLYWSMRQPINPIVICNVEEDLEFEATWNHLRERGGSPEEALDWLLREILFAKKSASELLRIV